MSKLSPYKFNKAISGRKGGLAETFAENEEQKQNFRDWAIAEFGRQFTGLEVECDDIPADCPYCEQEKDDIEK